jgi:hypothetical protein
MDFLRKNSKKAKIQVKTERLHKKIVKKEKVTL